MGNVHARPQGPAAAVASQDEDAMCGGGNMLNAKLVTGPLSNYVSFELEAGHVTPSISDRPASIACSNDAVSKGRDGDAVASDKKSDNRCEEQSTAERRFALGRLSRWSWCIIAAAILVTCAVVIGLVVTLARPQHKSPAGDPWPLHSDRARPPRCTSFDGLKTAWACFHYDDQGIRDDLYHFTTSPSLYQHCELTQMHTSLQRWTLDCVVNCELIDLATQQEQAVLPASNSVGAPGEVWTAPEQLKQSCAEAAAQEGVFALPSDFVSIALTTARPSGSGPLQGLSANVTYALETGLTSATQGVLDLFFKFAMDRDVVCLAFTGADNCSLGWY